jgi:hypothetical protein
LARDWLQSSLWAARLLVSLYGSKEIFGVAARILGVAAWMNVEAAAVRQAIGCQATAGQQHKMNFLGLRLVNWASTLG